MNVLELYSGIGGMHLALKESGVLFQVKASVDINTTANTVYKYNFPQTVILNKNVQSLTSKFIKKLDVNTILMSPPCQPFTRNGLKKDTEDARTCSFTYLLQILPELEINYLLMENVKGFEMSNMRNKFVRALEESEYIYQEFLLSPVQFGVPNARCRYYCLAKKKPGNFVFDIGHVMETLPYLHQHDTFSISRILEEEPQKKYYLPEDTIKKHLNLFDVCFKNSKRSCCFTKAYSRYAEGMGSILCEADEEKFHNVFGQLKNSCEFNESDIELVKSLGLRYFTPREVCRLMCFPERFNFPEDVSDKQRYMLLGNSINVKVVSELIKVLIS